ncbi:putative membrane protein [Enterobacter hormaechei]|nr:putative membrane protein [Enterobacter hormaechei]
MRKYINKSKRSFFKLGWFITLSFYVLKNVSFSQRSAIMGQNTAIILIFMILIK